MQRVLLSLSLLSFCVLLAVSSRVWSQTEKAGTADVSAPETKAPVMVAFADLKWLEVPGRKGDQYSLLSGDPQSGAYAEFRKVPAGAINELHSHSSEITNVVISGVWYTGTDANSAKDFGPGSFVLMPANWVHVSGCRPGTECVLYQQSNGKFDYKPVARAQD